MSTTSEENPSYPPLSIRTPRSRVPSYHIEHDVFRFMRDNKMAYGFNINILDDALNFPSLWKKTKEFMNEHPDFVHEDAEMEWLLDPETGGYNNC